MLRYLHPDHALIRGQFEAGLYIGLDDQGVIRDITSTLPTHDGSSAEELSGILIPGFINTHCHLELSHMRGAIQTGTGLIDFIFGVLTGREYDADQISKAISEADHAMYTSGIDAVGDICNTLHTSECKARSQMRYANFVEAYDLWQGPETSPLFLSHLETYASIAIKEKDYKILVPHAPYSVSQAAFAKILDVNQSKAGTISIHNQETPDENRFFEYGDGRFVEFFEKINLTTRGKPTGEGNAMDYALSQMDSQRPTLFVHNTMSTHADVERALAQNPQSYWVTCPNANLYIENRLPEYRTLLSAGATMTIGTDSLSSNWQLDILQEIKTIQRYNSYLSTEQLLTWATSNGAKALGFDDLGEIAMGKSPGLLLLDYRPQNEKLLEAHHTVRRIF